MKRGGAGSSQVSDELARGEMKDLAKNDEIDLSRPPASNKEKQELADGISYFRDLLIRHKFIAAKESTTINKRSVLIGKELLKRFLQMYESMVFTEQVTLAFEDEEEEKKEESGVLEGCSKEIAETGKIRAQAKKRKIAKEEETSETHEIIPFATKIKAVQIAELHPEWKLITLQRRATKLLKDNSQLASWKSDVEKGGTGHEKFEVIDRSVYDRFIEAREQSPAQEVTTRMLKQWAMATALQFHDGNFEFKASDGWLNSFKTKHHISQEQVAKHVRRKDEKTLEEMLESALKYQEETRKMIEQFDPNYVISTDLKGFEYKINGKIESTRKGKRIEEIDVGQMNESGSKTFTAQYALTLSGKLLPKVLICLGEVSDKFDKSVRREIDEYELRYSNVLVTCTKSGKLEESTYSTFLNGIMKPYVKDNEFLYIVDSPGGQRFEDIHHLLFTDDDELPTCTLSIVPSGCQAFCQPLEIYFHRQINNYLRHFEKAANRSLKHQQINSREDMIKIHSLIHDQLRAPVYEKMIRYAWYAARLNNADKSFFSNVNGVAFPEDMNNKSCECDSEVEAFIQCSWCRRFSCFNCFYDLYHPKKCKREPNNPNKI